MWPAWNSAPYPTINFRNTTAGPPAAGHLPAPGSNALGTAKLVRAKMAELAKGFPEGLNYSFPLDNTLFVKESVSEVYKTLFEAGVLVLLVIMVFLQDWRATLVPATTVPVTIIGAFAGMAAMGFTDQYADSLCYRAVHRHRGG